VPGNGRLAPLVSVVIPCLNEAESIGRCVREAHLVLAQARIPGEVVVADNGSTDGSGELARLAGARVVHQPRRGYGNACLAGFAAARGRYIVMADGDDTYDLSGLGRFIEGLESGCDLVMGSRLKGTIHPGAMPWIRRNIGNPVLTAILNILYGAGVSDAQCGMRAFRRELLPQLDLQATGMELASEQVIRSSKLGLTIGEVPIAYRPRVGESKLSPLTDGVRHLRVLLGSRPRLGVLLLGILPLLVGVAVVIASD